LIATSTVRLNLKIRVMNPKANSTCPKAALSLLFSILVISFIPAGALFAQAPQKMSYQAVIRDNANVLQSNKAIGMRISILQGSPTGTLVYQETYSPNPQTNINGLLTVTVGAGTPVFGTFSAINWAAGPYYIKTEADPTGGTTYTITGTSQLQSVPYALMANNIGSGVPYMSVAGKTSTMDSALFVVRNTSGQIVFAVYNEGVRIYVDNGAKGSTKGGFAIGGFGTGKGVSQPLFVVDPDSIRAYIDTGSFKGRKGGFAIGSFDKSKAGIEEYFRVTRDSSRIYINGTSSKAAKGGFAIGSFNGSKAGTSQYLRVTVDSTRIYTTDTIKGFSIGNLKSGISQNYMKMSPLNYFIGQESGSKTTPGAGDLGKFNSFMGYQAGLNNINGKKNVFIGHQSGLNNNADFNIFIGNESGKANNTGQYNSFLGYQTGLLNTSGNSNTFLGFQAGKNNQTGAQDTYMGYNSGMGLTANSTGNKNVFVGCASGSYHNSGDNNTFVGYSAGSANQTGASNVFLGNQAGSAETGSNRLYVDVTNTASPLLWGDFQNRRLVINGNSSSNINNRTFFVNGSAGGTGAWFNDSDLRLKRNVETISNAMQKVLELRGVTFYWRDSLNRDDQRHIGFIAQEARNVIPEVVGHNGAAYDMQYSPVTALLVEAFKEQHRQITDYMKSTEELKKLVRELITKNTELQNEVESLKSNSINQNR